MSYYFDEYTNVVSREKEIKVIIKDKEYRFITDNNVFSKHGLDFGTRTLLDTLNFNNIHGDILDFGCGYGPIGIIVKLNTNANVDMLDINERALNLTLKNSKLNNAEVNAFLSDGYQNIDKQYNYIITNPPIRVGKVKLYEVLMGAKNCLKINGELWFVINKNQGAKSVIHDLEPIYSNVEIKNKNKGFYIICCHK